MEKYDPRKDLAPRDIVARAIDSEMKKAGTEHVYLDCRHMDMKKFKEHFPNIYETCKSAGIDVAVQMIPVAPLPITVAAESKPMNGDILPSGIYMPAENVLPPVCMAPTGWPAIRCWKRWCLRTAVTWTPLKK